MMLRVAYTAILSLAVPTLSARDSLRVRSLARPDNKPQNPNSLFENDDDASFIECDVQLAMHSPPPQAQGRGRGQDPPGLDELDDDDDANENAGNLLHCITSDEHIYEIQGLDPAEKQRLSNEVSVADGKPHRYAFPGSKKTKGSKSKPGTILSVPARGRNKKYQAINIASSSETANSRHRKLVIRHEGNSTVLLLRVEALDAATTCSHQDCAANVFGGHNGEFDDFNMVTQISDCSYTKLRFQPPADGNGDLATYPGLINGTATIVLPSNVTGVNHGTVLDMVIAAAAPVVGPIDQYDHVMVFMPPGVDMGVGAAWGFVPGRYTWYHDGYRMSTGIHLHELGHNLGLSHSHGDGACYMGSGSNNKRCYNAAKSHWLGWYSEFHQYFDPTAEPSKLVELVGLADYDEAMALGDPLSQAVVLKINMFEDQSLYLTYNRKEKVNIDTFRYEDMVTIVRSNGPGSSGVVAGLNPGQKYRTPLVIGSGMELEVLVCDRNNGTPDTMVVSIHVVGLGEPQCSPSQPYQISTWEPTYSGGLSDSLVGYYTFDDDLLDSSGNGHHGLVGGGNVSYVDGIVGRALSLDGIDDFVSLPNVGDFNFGTGTDFTLTFWYRVSGDQSGSPPVITNKDWSSGHSIGWLVSSSYGPGSNGDDLSINLSDGSVRADSSYSMDVDYNTWHLVVIRIKRGEMMSLLRFSGGGYNLHEDAVGSITGSLDTGLPILIGGSHGSYTGKTKMDIDDLGIWRRALSSEEVDAIFQEGRYGKQLLNAMDPLPPEKDLMPNTLIANYELEGSFQDSSSNGLDATLEDGGGASFGTSVSGSHFTLDNINAPAKSFATVPESSLLDFSTANFTISFWHRSNIDYSSLPGSDPSIVTNKNWYSGSNPGFTVGIGANGKLEYNSADVSGTRCDYDGPGGTMNDGQWHFVVLTQSLGVFGQYALYLDGKKVAQESCGITTLSTEYPVKVGGSWVYPAYYSGDIDKIMIFNSVLSHGNVFDLYIKGRDVTMTYSPTVSTAPTLSPTKKLSSSPSLSPSKSPTLSPLSCQGVYDNVICCGTESVKQADYRGSISQTQAGVECQRWDTQSPHSHTRTPGYYPNSGLESNNYCRNPDGEPRSWCYTSDPNRRWDYCTVPSCGALTTSPPSSSPTAGPSASPSTSPLSRSPSKSPSAAPSATPSTSPSSSPTKAPTNEPSSSPSKSPSTTPSKQPTDAPTKSPTHPPTNAPTHQPTDAPTKAPAPAPISNPTETEVCTGLDTSCCGSFWFGLKQADYRGNISKTVGGIECQAWSSQSPHGHTRTPGNYPNAGLESNDCRNPDGESRSWCYTSSGSKRWDYCDVPSCPACEAGDPDQCGCSEVKQADYTGTISTTISGEECQAWSSQSPHGHSFSWLDSNSNFCRNPDGEPQAWCYTTNPNKRWEICGVPMCGQ